MNLKTPLAGFAHEPTLNCPNCNHEIRLTESLAAPLIEETRRRFQEQLANKDVEVARNLELVRKEREDLAKAREQVNDQVARKLASERAQITAAEAKKAREAVSADLQAKEAEAADLRRNLETNNANLAEAQQAHAEVLRKQRELDEARRELDLTVEKRVQTSVDQVRIKARQDADEAARLRVMEKDQTIESMARTIEELKRKAEQGSQQSQGEVLELELEEVLRGRFPTDVVEPVGKGELGADLVQQVNGGIGQPAGTILWESKPDESLARRMVAEAARRSTALRRRRRPDRIAGPAQGRRSFRSRRRHLDRPSTVRRSVGDRAPTDLDRGTWHPARPAGPADQDGAGLPVPDRHEVSPTRGSRRREIQRYEGRSGKRAKIS